MQDGLAKRRGLARRVELMQALEKQLIDGLRVGMSQEVIKKIIDTNQHHSSKGTNNEHGTGLGLYLVKDLIAQNNGTLLIDSVVGEGSVFTIRVPKSLQ